MEPADILDPAIPVEAGIATASKPFRDGKGQFLKWSRGGSAVKVRREWDFLMAMAASGVTPLPILYGDDFILMQDLGDPTSLPPGASASAVQGSIDILNALFAAGIRHNDLRPQNLIYRDGTLYCIDFGRATWMHEDVGPYRENEDVILMADSLLKITRREVWHPV